MRLAALTMAYNEPVWAGVWARFYSRQVGAANCFLLDHGSDDGSTEELEVHVERLPRSALDENARAATVSAVTAELLRVYDAVVHADVDELVLADPSRYGDLVAFAEAVPDLVVTAAGLDVQHLPAEEPPLICGGRSGSSGDGCGSARRCASRPLCGGRLIGCPAFIDAMQRWSSVAFTSSTFAMRIWGSACNGLGERAASRFRARRRICISAFLTASSPEWSRRSRSCRGRRSRSR